MNRNLKVLLMLGVLLMAGGEALAGYDYDTVAKRNRLGFSLLTPGGLNLVYTLDLRPTTVMLSGGGLRSPEGSCYGFQVGFSILRSERTRNFRALNIMGGYSEVDGDTWKYVGLEGFFSWRAFFMAPGITVGSGDYPSPQISGQLGFIWAF